ncbi:MAG: hypothetical protein RIT45_3449, partial [Pseudomonadota bacterium]
SPLAGVEHGGMLNVAMGLAQR